MITLKNLVKSYDKKYNAVDGINLEIGDGEFIVLVGPSGCGKTTTLRMIAGLESVTSGEILLGGKLINDVEPKDRDLAIVFQNYALYPNKTVYKNMSYPLELRKLPKKEIDLKVRQTAATLGIEEYLDRKPGMLSGGQKQRVALGRCMVRSPRAFLMDEPLSNLDAKLRVQMRSEIINLQKLLKKTFIYVTHDQVEAMTMGDRIVVMNNGKIMQTAVPDELYENPANKFVAGFIGSPSMDFTKTTQGKLILNDFSMETGSDRVLWAGIRPEKIYTDSSGGDLSFTAKVLSVEPLGAEKYIYIDVNGSSFTVRDFTNSNIRQGEERKFYFKKDSIQYFDETTDERVII